ncbi:type II toxin-antitoxin system RelE/ParE family toxin [Flavobacterium cellulosilyticum]|uniref:Toxin n=1 Tax=Flavobacterium cellulosilyticum TaxID=2541731 RepID=A0A4R5CQ39_9FLAO|nr:type II toxin-antitoxin system RelE/ParE family toxin [Flavobacterium cellulosilyticum]TDD99774.1 type II toxin-antitoxin system RelE/ParE family toxin [Flavobacterium cellulosilyticum]
MGKFTLTNKAVEDLSTIWDYTYEVWSENQADKYYYGLIEDCKQLAENQSLGKVYDQINEGIFGYKSGQHILFYRKLSETEIEIIRFLHCRMDLKNRIQE